MSRTYTTVQGDKWDSIAYAQLGSIKYADKIMNLNQEYREYYIFPAGIILNLPDVAVESEVNIPPWRRRTSG